MKAGLLSKRTAAIKETLQARKRGETRREYLLRKCEKGKRWKKDCWNWRGHPPNKYATAEYNAVSMSAHRMAYIEFNGPIPEGEIVRHKCDNPRCINPQHLELGTKKDNRRDFMRRHPKAMELCLKASKVGAKGVKKFWDDMSPAKRKAFIKRRAEIQQRIRRERLMS